MDKEGSQGGLGRREAWGGDAIRCVVQRIFAGQLGGCRDPRGEKQ